MIRFAYVLALGFAAVHPAAGREAAAQAGRARDHAPQQQWHRIISSTGLIFAIDLKSIASISTGGADAIVYIPAGRSPDILNMRRYRFDCRGTFVDITEVGGISISFGRGTVVAEMSAIACAAATSKRR